MEQSKEGLIVIVDDNADVLGFITTLLTTRGFQTLSCDNAADALEYLRQNGADLVLSDITMPAVSGLELLERIRELDPDMPVILMTGFTDFDNAVDAVKMRAFDFILKPFKNEQLIRSVEKALTYVRLLRTEKDYRHLLEEYTRGIEALVAERTVSLLALTIADKIRNPATVIGLTCKKILEGQEDTNRIREHLATIVAEAEKLDAIVLQFQALLKNKKSLFFYLDVNDIVRAALSATQKEAAAGGLRLDVNLSELPLRINAEKNLMQVALTHVIRNAIAATPRGGTVTISTLQEADAAVVTIIDTGCGIPGDALGRIFDPFFSTKEYSFGMGLPLVRQIVTEHMGKVDVESLPGRGTTFRITLPCRWTEMKLPAPADQSA